MSPSKRPRARPAARRQFSVLLVWCGSLPAGVFSSPHLKYRPEEYGFHSSDGELIGDAFHVYIHLIYNIVVEEGEDKVKAVEKGVKVSEGRQV